jgi:hypothetical protein
MNSNKNMDREQCMLFFRDDEKLNTLTVEDRVEIFRTVLVGSSDLTKELLNELLIDYGMEDINVM